MRTVGALVTTLALSATVAMAGCGGGSGGAGGSTYTTPGTAITVAPGKRFTIELESTPSTGYSWELSSAPGDQVALIDSDFEPSGRNQPGASGVQRFVFQGVSAGPATLAFAYLRPWEQGVAPAKTADFAVTVS